ncbi:TIGR03086 family metal-binding protein [Amycolatopsis albispora]|uniref:Mycothiol-dependent maleylpyruvate isomerase metal-binding domain-containing protein n=1 Tax=Amycolatopsis albispora TaxID=1804986 RepID=A0A344LI28_9PSEU|nr:TIGR03086 family metal-binding protein [Amycolatopsis albispora]AXB47702.1 hypothetical protein A4R43_38975 [Amycolatopsis albispora]
MTDPLDDLTAATARVAELIDGIRRWDAETPCPAWNVRDVVNHLVLGNRLFTGILRGEAAVTPEALDPAKSDALGDAPADAYRKATGELRTEFRQPEIRTRIFEVPVGAVPGVAAILLRTTEELVHGWDLARATGQPPGFPEDVAERALEFSRAKLADVPPDRSPFAPPKQVPSGAPAIDRLAALLGR